MSTDTLNILQTAVEIKFQLFTFMEQTKGIKATDSFIKKFIRNHIAQYRQLIVAFTSINSIPVDTVEFKDTCAIIMKLNLARKFNVTEIISFWQK